MQLKILFVAALALTSLESHASLQQDCVRAAKKDLPRAHIARTKTIDGGRYVLIRFREQGLLFCHVVKDEYGQTSLQLRLEPNCYNIVHWDRDYFGGQMLCESAPRLPH